MIATRARMVVAESIRAALAQRVGSLIVIVIVGVMCATVLLTAGRTAGAQQAILSSIDSAGTRSILVRADTDAGLQPEVLDRIAAIDGIDWAGAFGPATDVTNVDIAGGERVPLRLAWGASFEPLGVDVTGSGVESSAWASDAALRELGISQRAGGVRQSDGAEYSVVGELQVPSYLAFLEPLAIAPQATTAEGTVSVLVVIASTPDLVVPVSRVLQSVLGVDDPEKVTMSTSAGLADLRRLIDVQLGTFSNGLVLVSFGIAAVLVGTLLFGIVTMRRKDFGRRRALGASRGLIVALVLMQVGALSIVGAVAGAGAAGVTLAVSDDPMPDGAYFGALCVLAVAVACAGAVAPAIYASRRQPILELRVP